MRTTITLDDDLAGQLQELSHRLRRPFKAVVNESIRKGLSGLEKLEDAPPFRVQAHRGELRPGIDDRRFNQMADELEIESAAGKLSRGR
ncbi:MAG: type II toxin-antitoxin system antitoxin VapB33 [Bryobacteraceae bacterium]